jgi:hypothetical protein
MVIRVFFSRELGVRVHAHEGESEMVLGVGPLRVLQGETSPDVRARALRWTSEHEGELLGAWRRYESGRRW